MLKTSRPASFERALPLRWRIESHMLCEIKQFGKCLVRPVCLEPKRHSAPASLTSCLKELPPPVRASNPRAVSHINPVKARDKRRFLCGADDLPMDGSGFSRLVTGRAVSVSRCGSLKRPTDSGRKKFCSAEAGVLGRRKPAARRCLLVADRTQPACFCEAAAQIGRGSPRGDWPSCSRKPRGRYPGEAAP